MYIYSSTCISRYICVYLYYTSTNHCTTYLLIGWLGRYMRSELRTAWIQLLHLELKDMFVHGENLTKSASHLYIPYHMICMIRMYVIMSVCYIYLHIIYPGDDGTAKHQLIFSGEWREASFHDYCQYDCIYLLVLERTKWIPKGVLVLFFQYLDLLIGTCIYSYSLITPCYTPEN